MFDAATETAHAIMTDAPRFPGLVSSGTAVAYCDKAGEKLMAIGAADVPTFAVTVPHVKPQSLDAPCSSVVAVVGRTAIVKEGLTISSFALPPL